jgi:hypothetical protein
MRAFQFTPNPLIFLLVLLALILSVLPVSANVFYNGDFETGSLSPWLYDYYGINGGHNPSVLGYYKYTGNYGVYFSCSNYDGQGYKAIWQRIDFDKVTGDNLTFYANVRNQGDGKFQVYIDSTKVYESTADYGYNVFYPISINLRQYNFTGTKFIYFRAYANYGPGMEVMLDDIHLDGVPYDQELPEPEPDVPIYDGNGNVYFSQNSYTYNQTPRLYFDMTDLVDTIGRSDRIWPGVDTDPNGYMSPFAREFLQGGWITYYELRFYEADYYNGRFYDVTSYPFHSYDISDIDYDSLGPVYYYDVFYPLRGRWIRGELVRHIEYFYGLNPDIFPVYYVNSIDTVMDKDYAYCYDLDQVVYVPPEQEPQIQQPNSTQPNSTIEYPVVPAYNSTYTPPQSQEGNETTVGTSFLDGYYDTVDSIFNPVNVTMSAVVSLVTSPIDIISSSVFQVNGYAADTFGTALFYISPFGLFFTVIFNAIPDDAEIVIMFALICNLILIVLRWK